MASPLQVRSLSGSLGAEVTGVKLAELTEREAAELRKLLLEHLVLFFPAQHLTVEEHVSFGSHFGEVVAHPHFKNPYTQHPKILEFAASHGGVADEWHSDISFQAEPSKFAILKMVKCPPIGGDTLWANMYKAYEELSAPLREMCDGLTALHDATPHGHPEKMAIHPVVRIHPESGRRSLFVNEHFTRRIVEMSHDESEHLLSYLTEWATSSRFSVRYKWSEGTLALWDNRCTQHYVLNDFQEERVVQRVTIMGDDPQAAAEVRWEPYVRNRTHGSTSRYDRQLSKFLSKETEASQ